MRRNRPLRAVRSATNRYGLFERKLALASSPDQRIAASADYLRSALKRADPSLADQVATQVVEMLVSSAREVDAATVAAVEKRRQIHAAG